MIPNFQTYSLTDMLSMGKKRMAFPNNPIGGMQQMVAMGALSEQLGNPLEQLHMERGKQSHQVMSSAVEDIQSGTLGTLNDMDEGAFDLS